MEKIITIKGASINELWETHSDIKNWAKWQEEIEWTKVEGEIQKGSKFSLKPKKGPKVNLEILTFEKPKQFTDVSYLPLCKMYTTTYMKETENGTEIKVAIELKGFLSFLWKNIVAKDIIEGHQKQYDNMVNYIKSSKNG